MLRLAISLLGTFHVALDGKGVTAFQTDKARGLLAYIAVEADRPHARELLAGMFWPDYPDASARNSLRQALYHLRRALGEANPASPFLLLTPGSVQFNMAGDCWLDVIAFVELVTACRRHAHSRFETCPVCMASLEEALGLYRGDFLVGMRVADSAAFEEWTLYWREYLHRLALESMVDLSNYYERLADYEQAWRWAERQLQMEPWREEAHQQLMRILARLGQRSAALAQYESCRRALAQELGVEPGRETRRLYEAILSGPHDATGLAPATPPLVGQMLRGPAPTRTRRPEHWSAFVGREAELARLESYLAETLAGQGRVAFVIGQAGSGKTSLIHEFTRRALIAHPDLVAPSGSCNSQAGVGDPYLPFRDILQTLSGDIEARRAGHSISPEHAGRLWRLLPDCVQALVEQGPDLVDLLVPGAQLLQRAGAAALRSEDGTGSQAKTEQLAELVARRAATGSRSSTQQANLFEQVTRVLRSLAARWPLLLVIDDLQWADSGTLSLLFHLGRRLGESRILLLGAYRPDDVTLGGAGQRNPLEAVRNEFEREMGALSVDLTAEPGRAFIDALLDSEPNHLSDGFRTALEDRTEGHPLFTVEVLRGLAERGDLVRDEHGRWCPGPQADWERLPARVEAIIAERIRSLPQELQRVLAVASVEGMSFTAEVVASVLGEPEEAVVAGLSGPLRRQLLVVSESLRRLHGQRLSRYRFGHSLFQSYVYHHLDPIERARWHEAIGSRLAELHGEDAAEVAVQLAWHFERAGLVTRAVDYLLEAGHRAARLAAYQEALTSFSRGLALVSTLPQTSERTRLEFDLSLARAGALVPLHRLADPIRMQAAAPALPLGRQSGGMQAIYALMLEAGACRDRSDFARAIELGMQIQVLAEASQDRQAALLAHFILGTVAPFMGDPIRGRASLEAALRLYSDAEDGRLVAFTGADVKVMMLTWLASVLWVLGYPDQTASRDREAISLAQQLGQPSTFTAALTGSIWLALYSRTDRNLRPKIETLQCLVDERGLESVRPWVSVYSGWLLVQQGRGVEGIDVMSKSIASLGQGWGAPGLAVVLAQTCLEARLYEQGLSAVNEALAMLEQGLRGRYFEAELHRLQGTLTLAYAGPGSAESAEKSFIRAIEAARSGQFRSWELRASVELARLWRRQGKASEAEELLAGIYGWFTEGFETPDLAEARALLEELISVAGMARCSQTSAR